jgi:hypothetical protein
LFARHHQRSIIVLLTQRLSAGRLATGSGASGLVCDGTEHTTTVRMIASGERAFKKLTPWG